MDSLHSLFEEQTDNYPESICVICGHTQYSYLELEHSANKMAHWFIAQSIGPDDIVCILVDNPLDFYVIMLGVLKAGAAYLPIDPNYPARRIEYILNDSKAKLCITSNPSLQTLAHAENTLYYEEVKSQLTTCLTTRPVLTQHSPTSLCYVIYTSGTTGNPKGVAIPHCAANNYVKAALNLYGMTREDRVYQGFKVAFDASIEEMWMAFGSGATLIAIASREVHEGAALIQFLNFYKVTFFSTVPTLLAMLTPNIPTLKKLILGGEVCSSDLIMRWTNPALRIFNTYGPSEATIITTCLECKPERKITIGKPIANCEVIILGEQLNPLPPGSVGELCIGGVCLARGYVNNPDLTQEKFIIYPSGSNKRFYRSGDLALINSDGEIEYCGRIDEQVKLRGYRVELSEIESSIRSYPGILNSAVVVHELDSKMHYLIAYVVLKENASFEADELRKSLRSVLPSYMLPNLIEIVPAFPQLPSGKVNKKELPVPQFSNILRHLDYDPPQTVFEKKICAIWEDVLKISPISINAHFFDELGGHSLAAAKIVSTMRNEAEMSGVSLVDVFENATISQLAKEIENNTLVEQTEELDNSAQNKPKSFSEKIQYGWCIAIQALMSLVLITLPSWYFFIIFLVAVTFSIVQSSLSLMTLVSLWLVFVILLEPALIVLSILMKWLLLGKIKPGKHKLWGWYYTRWWVVKQIQDMAPISHLTGSPFIVLYYRLMGAKIGKNCYIGTDQLDSYDLINIGDNSSLCADVILSGYKVEKGWLKIGSITIGENCFVGANSVFGLNTKLGNGSVLGEQSLLSDGNTIRENESHVGSPCRPGEVHLPKITTSANPSLFKRMVLIVCHWLLLSALELIYILATAPGIFLIVYFCYTKSNLLNFLWALPVAAVSYIVLLVTQIYVFKKILGPIKEGAYSLKSFTYLKIWFIERLMTLSLNTVESIYGTIYSAWWFRSLGADIGKNSELSTVSSTFPEMLHIGSECFIADSSLLAPPRIYKGYFILNPIYLGNRVFIGNSALVPGKTQIRDNCLIGCATLSPESTPSNTNWIGTPALFLPTREKFNFSEQETYLPSKKAKWGRGIVELFKIGLPPLFLYTILLLDVITFMHLREHLNLLWSIVSFPIFSVTYVFLIVNVIILLKWLFVGKYEKKEVPMWHSFVWYSELITSLYDTIVVPFLLEALLGTPFISPFLRLLGAKIGKDVFINTPYFSEFDLVNIGDRVSLNRECIIQTHLYEDRIFKMFPITIEDDVSIGDRSIILYDTLMKNRSTLGSFSLLMKGEVLYSNSCWEGIPAKRVYRSQFKDKVW